MGDATRDPVLDDAIAELRKTPPVDPAALARVVRASVEARGQDLTDVEEPVSGPRYWRAAAAVFVVAAAALGGFLLRGAPATHTAPTTSAVVASAPVPATRVLEPVAARDVEAMAVPTQFVLESRGATRVALVGDFNGWSPTASPLHRHDGTSLWSVTLPVAPGRHLYGFMVDDSVFTLDPRRPAATDKDIGAKASVLIVGRP